MNGSFFALKIVCICVFWYTASAFQSVTNKYALQLSPYPLTITLFSCMCSAIFSNLYLCLMNIPQANLSNTYILRRVMPISLGRSIGLASSYFALWRVSVSYAQTAKATSPIFTVVMARFILKDRLPASTYFSLIPIVLGTIIASATEFQLDFLGLGFALLSTGIFSFLNILVKKIYEETRIHSMNLLSLNSMIAATFLFPCWILSDLLSIMETGLIDQSFLGCLIVSGALAFVQNLCAFNLMEQLHPVSYSVIGTFKRVSVIFLSIAILRNPVTISNLSGMLVTTIGAYLYNRTKAIKSSAESRLFRIDRIGNGLAHKDSINKLNLASNNLASFESFASLTN